MAPVGLAQIIPLERVYFEDCALAEITHFNKSIFLYRIASLTDEPLPWPTTVGIHKDYARRGTEVAWRRACDHVKYGKARQPGPPRIILRENARQKAFRVSIFYSSVVGEDVDADCWIRKVFVYWEDRRFEWQVNVPKASIENEVEEALAKLQAEAEVEAQAVPSIEVEEDVQEVKRTVVFTVAPQKGRRHRMEVWSVDGKDVSTTIGTVVDFEKLEDGSRSLVVKVDVEGIKGLFLQGVLPDRMFSAQFRAVVECVEEERVEEEYGKEKCAEKEYVEEKCVEEKCAEEKCAEKECA